jgi:MFS family permease
MATSTNQPRPSLDNRSAFVLVLFMWGAYFQNYTDRQAIFAIFPVLREELGLTDTQLGLTGSIFLWVYGLFCPIAGQIADRCSKRAMVVWSLVLWSLVSIGTGLAESAFVLLALRAAMGISESLYMPAAIALTANAYSPEKRSRAISFLTTAQICGTVGGAWFGGWMAERGMWREAFFILGGSGVLYAWPYYRFLRGMREDEQVETKSSGSKLAIGDLVKVPTYLMLCIAFPLFVFGLWLLYGWLPSFVHDKFQLDLADAAFVATAYMQIATLVGMMSGGFLADKLYAVTKASRLWMFAASLLFCAPCLWALAYTDSLMATRIAAAGFGLFSGLCIGTIFPAAFEVVPANTRASAVGVLNFCGAVLSGFAPLLGGAWRQTLGIELLLACTAGAYVLGAVVLMLGIKYLFPRDYARIH